MAEHALIDRYLGELRRQLRRSAEADDIVAEVADHLLEGVVRRQERGLTLFVAERSVLTEFGNPTLVGLRSELKCCRQPLGVFPARDPLAANYVPDH